MDQKAYFKEVFGTEYPERERIEAALDRAHEIRQFEIRLYWQRSLFFWGFLVVLFTGLFFLIGTKQEFSILDKTEQEFSILDKTEQKVLIRENELLFSVSLFVLCCLGLLVSFAWLYIHKGSRTWQKNWEHHIDLLEDMITGNLYKSVIGKGSEFFAPGQIHKTIIKAFIIVWILLIIYTAYELCCQFILYFCIEKPHSVCVFSIFYILLFLIGRVIYRDLMAERKDSELSWRTSEDSLPKKNDYPGELRLFPRDLPEVGLPESTNDKSR